MLKAITKRYLQPNKKEITVYKIFSKLGNKYFSQFSHQLDYGGKLKREFFSFPPIDEWISCYCDYSGRKWEDYNLYAKDQENLKLERYPRGFHSFLSLKDAKRIYGCRLNNLIYYTPEGEYSFELCECKAKYRLIEGTLSCVRDDILFSVNVCVSRGIKIIKEIS